MAADVLLLSQLLSLRSRKNGEEDCDLRFKSSSLARAIAERIKLLESIDCNAIEEGTEEKRKAFEDLITAGTM